MTDERSAWEDQLLEAWRANGGVVTSGPLAGHPLLVMTSTGARSGEPRRAILTFSRDGEDYIVAGSASGAPTDPAWLQNVRSDPSVTIEAEGRTFPATATIVDDTDHARLWPQHVAALPHFGEYPDKAGRVIPVVRITPA